MNDEDFIRSVPKFIYKSDKITKEFILDKLIEANKNYNIIMLARGEGRERWKEYIQSSEFFHWGIKCANAYIETENNFRILKNLPEEQLRELLNPEGYSVELINALLDQIEFSMEYFSRRRNDRKSHGLIGCVTDNGSLLKMLCKNIRERINIIQEKNQLIYFKMLLCSILHKLGNPVFNSRTMYISTAKGNDRYLTTKKYGRGPWCRSDYIKNKYQKSNYIILDYWVNKRDRESKFLDGEEIYMVFSEYGIDCGKYYEKEVLIPYVLFPHQIVGYYYFEDNECIGYVINPFYINVWESDPSMKIGDFIYIEQDINEISNEFPFDMIYDNKSNVEKI